MRDPITHILNDRLRHPRIQQVPHVSEASGAKFPHDLFRGSGNDAGATAGAYESEFGHVVTIKARHVPLPYS
jgi:hypothetical protein